MVNMFRDGEQLIPMLCLMSRTASNRTDFKSAFINRTAEARKSAGYTQNEIATILGIDQGTYKQYETRSVLPHMYVIRFCTACRIDVEWLYGYSEHVRRRA
jgi:DNA-binding XRE family transcriptional regulator